MLRRLLSYLSPPTEGGVVVLTPEQRAAVRALYTPSVLMLGGSAVLMLAVYLGYVQSTLSTFTTYGENVMFNSLCLGILVCYATLPARRGELRWVVPLGIVGELIRFVNHPSWWSFTMRLQTFGYVSGLITLVFIGWRAWRAEGDEALWARAMLLLSLIMFFFPNVSWMLHTIVINHTPTLVDAYAYTVDGAFGVQPAAQAALLVKSSTFMWYLTFYVYNELPLFMIIAVLLSLRWPRACYGQLMLHMTLIGLVGFICYKMVPMKGIDLFVGEPWPAGPLPHVSPPAPYDDASGATRNCYPSLHLGWMLAIFFGTRRVARWVTAFFGFCVAVMVVATLNVGHYAVDLVASVPYVVAFFGLINVAREGNRTSRVAAVAVGTALFCGFTWAMLHDPEGLASSPARLAVIVGLILALALGVENWMANTTVTRPTADEIAGLDAPMSSQDTEHAEAPALVG